MKRRRSPEQIIKILKAIENGSRLGDVCREHNISEQTYYRWMSKSQGSTTEEEFATGASDGDNLFLKASVAARTRAEPLKFASMRSSVHLTKSHSPE